MQRVQGKTALAQEAGTLDPTYVDKPWNSSSAARAVLCAAAVSSSRRHDMASSSVPDSSSCKCWAS